MSENTKGDVMDVVGATRTEEETYMCIEATTISTLKSAFADRGDTKELTTTERTDNVRLFESFEAMGHTRKGAREE